MQRRQNKIVGFDDEAKTLINYLNEPTQKLEVISIIGMPGLGKTTLAWKIFQDPDITFEFPTRIWVNISDDLNLSKVLRTILTNLSSQSHADSITDDKLVHTVKEQLQLSGKFLIVMDDVWSTDAWDKLKSILPLNDKSQGRVLITSRELRVGYHANAKRKPHQLRFLDPKESWDLLQYEVYDELDVVHEELVPVGKVISENCDGLPLSIVVIGGVLKEKIADASGIVSAIKKQWKEVATKIQNYLVYGDKTKRLEKIIRLSYEKIPYGLRDCFLYLGVFPEDAEISAKKLTLLWMAEGFVQGINGKSLEDTAHENLQDLINRNLLMVHIAKPNGEPKICRVHDTIREFCRTEAKFDNLNLFQEISLNYCGIFEPSVENLGNNTYKYRRLCIHSDIRDFFLVKPKVHNARTFLCFPKSPVTLEAKDITPVIDAFHLVRVLDAKDIKFPKFPQRLTKLIHLRYLTLTFANDLTKSLPDLMSNLWNLQTLIVHTPARTLEIKADIWKMRHLRHLKAEASIILETSGKGGGGSNLQTLDRLSPQSCTDTLFNKAKNLNKLGIQGDLSSPLYSKSLGKLGRLTKLKLVHKAINGQAPMKCICSLPEASTFPPNLKMLVLGSTHLEWKQMAKLANLGSLVALKLKETAFTGDSWEAFGYSFKHLEILDIERADVKSWEASEDCFPELRSLLLKNCEELVEVPPVLLGKKLEMLSLERVKRSAVSSAERIKEEKGGSFVLKIAPADKIKRIASSNSQILE